MRQNKNIEKCIIIRRYKRFLADVRLHDGEQRTVHCPNSGSMATCWEEGWPAVISDSENPKRKLRYTLEMTHNGKCWIGINTHRANDLAEEAIRKGIIPELSGYARLEREKKYGQNSRIDILLQNSRERCYVEVKNVTLVVKDAYQFPDSVTGRGLKHLHELIAMKKEGHRAVMLFVVQRADGQMFEPATHIDPAYGEGLKKAARAGVELLCYRADVQPEETRIVEKIPIQLS